jgi:hypothetical protein
MTAGWAPHNKDFETDSPIVTVLASAAPARTRANYGSRLKSLLYEVGEYLLIILMDLLQVKDGTI